MPATRETIDCTPTWEGILPILVTGLLDGNDTAKQIAKEELRRMAQLADAYVALVGRGPED